jgi:hypothetical protein
MQGKNRAFSGSASASSTRLAAQSSFTQAGDDRRATQTLTIQTTRTSNCVRASNRHLSCTMLKIEREIITIIPAF